MSCHVYRRSISIFFSRGDVTSREAIIALAEKIRQEVGDVTMLVNNAGIMSCKPLLAHTEKEVRAEFEVNIIAHIWVCI